MNRQEVPMLQITDRATTHLLRARTEEGFDERAGARFVRGSAGVGLTFAAAPEQGDQVLTGSALPVYVAEDVTGVLDRAVIDVSAEDGESRLVLRSQADAPSIFND
jgi:Fe-S cluster assembly iron-binding protein IscA